MYEFVDIDDSQTTSSLPSEAVCYNGIWLDNEIEGFRTIAVSGRELLIADVDDKKIDFYDGSNYIGKSYEPREITVKYQIIATSAADFRTQFNKLNELLDGEEVKIIFNDETDKYFIGTKTDNETVDSGLNSVIGEFAIYCSDPFKYNVNLTTFTAEADTDGVLTATIVNSGSVAAPINYTITNTSDNGFVGIASAYGAIQLGKIEEVDGVDYTNSDIISTSLIDDVSWVTDTGTNLQVSSNTTAGTFDTAETDYLALATSGSTANGWNGAMKTLTLDSPSNNVYMYVNSWFETGLPGQTGLQTVCFIDENDDPICTQSIYKTDMAGDSAKVSFRVQGTKKKGFTFTPNAFDSTNPFNVGRGHSDMRKEGDTITFYYWGNHYSYVVPGIKNLNVAKIQVYIAQYGSRNLSSQYVTRNYLRTICLRSDVEYWRDVPNRYANGDVIYIDGNAANVYVNDMPRVGDEVKGSAYFQAPTGSTDVTFAYSSFATAPTITASIRERWL